MKLKSLLILAFTALLFVGCKTPQDISYFQDGRNFRDIVVSEANEIKVKRGDKLSIVVSSKDPELAAMFNLSISGYRVGASSSSTGSLGSSGYQISCYSVDDRGEIDFPVLGKIKVEGCNRQVIANFIKEQLIAEEYLMDPIVTVEFANLYFSVLGEVARPGRFYIEHDRVTLLDAIGMAGDLTINGQRKNVTVWREEGDHQKVYTVDLTSARNIYTSPVFYLQQKDIVYVEPNDARKRQSTINGNTMRSTSFWMSVASMLMTVVLFIRNF